MIMGKSNRKIKRYTRKKSTGGNGKSIPRKTKRALVEKSKSKRRTQKFQERIVKQREKRQLEFTSKRQPLCNFAYSFCHGSFLLQNDPNRLFQVPYNIHLIQYTPPGKLLYAIEIYYLLKQLFIEENGELEMKHKLDQIHPSPILKYNDTGVMYFPHEGTANTFIDILPNTETTNLQLQFEDDVFTVFENYMFDMCIGMPDRSYIYPIEHNSPIPKDTDLKTVLEYVSREYERMCQERQIINPKPLKFIQLSCRPGDYYDVENLTHDLRNVQIGNYKCNLMRNIKFVPHPQYFDWIEENFTPIYLPYDDVDTLNKFKEEHCDKYEDFGSSLMETNP
mgnify:CR=1 FL=1